MRRSGALLLTALVVAAGCDQVPGLDRPTLELNGETITLEDGVELHEVRLGAGPGGAALERDTIVAASGDVVRFLATDARTYAVSFDPAGLSSEAAAFLDRTGQTRSPPLVDAGTAWIITLEGAPPGRYPFELANGTRGVLVVTD